MKKTILLLVLAVIMPLSVNAGDGVLDNNGFDWLDKYLPSNNQYKPTNYQNYTYGGPVPQIQHDNSAVERHRKLMEQFRYEASQVKPPQAWTHKEMCRFLAPPGGDRQFCFEN